jgi:hypothetical protein
MTSDAKQNQRASPKRGIPNDLFGALLEGLAAFGLFSGAAVVAAIGKFFLAGMLAFFGVLMFLRFKRGRVNK